jgi:hypothetical protein
MTYGNYGSLPPPYEPPIGEPPPYTPKPKEEPPSYETLFGKKSPVGSPIKINEKRKEPEVINLEKKSYNVAVSGFLKQNLSEQQAKAQIDAQEGKVFKRRSWLLNPNKDSGLPMEHAKEGSTVIAQHMFGRPPPYSPPTPPARNQNLSPGSLPKPKAPIQRILKPTTVAAQMAPTKTTVPQAKIPQTTIPLSTKPQAPSQPAVGRPSVPPSGQTSSVKQAQSPKADDTTDTPKLSTFDNRINEMKKILNTTSSEFETTFTIYNLIADEMEKKLPKEDRAFLTDLTKKLNEHKEHAKAFAEKYNAMTRYDENSKDNIMDKSGKLIDAKKFNSIFLSNEFKLYMASAESLIILSPKINEFVKKDMDILKKIWNKSNSEIKNRPEFSTGEAEKFDHSKKVFQIEAALQNAFYNPAKRFIALETHVNSIFEACPDKVQAKDLGELHHAIYSQTLLLNSKKDVAETDAALKVAQENQKTGKVKKMFEKDSGFSEVFRKNIINQKNKVIIDNNKKIEIKNKEIEEKNKELKQDKKLPLEDKLPLIPVNTTFTTKELIDQYVLYYLNESISAGRTAIENEITAKANWKALNPSR